jgi:hypothetical protein
MVVGDLIGEGSAQDQSVVGETPTDRAQQGDDAGTGWALSVSSAIVGARVRR